ncbi:MAG: hypothetical protein ACK5NU_03890 [Fusobacterium ulcerans]|uniref:hypothetical protein n=1 Tax=Fusobacterium ulcerans TaxID=861 RepID=UPI003A88EC26
MKLNELTAQQIYEIVHYKKSVPGKYLPIINYLYSNSLEEFEHYVALLAAFHYGVMIGKVAAREGDNL